MGKIRTVTFVRAPMERCFRLALSIDLHEKATQETAVEGVTSGLIGPGDTVTWKSRRFVGSKTYETLLEIWRPYSYFREIMTAGPFEAFEHEHHFAAMNDGTRIRDEVRFTASRGWFGRLLEFLLRKRILKSIQQKNALIKQIAESGDWHTYLDGQRELDLNVYQANQPGSQSEVRRYAHSN